MKVSEMGIMDLFQELSTVTDEIETVSAIKNMQEHDIEYLNSCNKLRGMLLDRLIDKGQTEAVELYREHGRVI
jgi:hypothetical protein